MVEEEVREIGSTRRDSKMPLVEIDEAMSKNDSSPQDQRQVLTDSRETRASTQQPQKLDSTNSTNDLG